MLAELAKDVTPRKPMHEYLAHLPEPPSLSFEGSAFLATEFNRIRQGKPPIKFARKVRNPPADANDIQGWEQAVANAQAELGYQNSRMIHLQLLKKYGKDAWVAHNEELAQLKVVLERESEEVKIEVNQINFNRKRDHERAGAKLTSLESKYWATLASITATADAVNEVAKKVKINSGE